MYSKVAIEQTKKETYNQIVPVLGLLNEEIQVIGTAIVLKCGLIITAAHTFYNEVKEEGLVICASRKDEVFEIEVNNKRFALGEPLYERYSWDYKTIVDETYHDLSIFKLPEGLMIESKLALDNFIEDGHMVIKGFPNTNNQIETQSCDIDNRAYSIRTYQKQPTIRKRFTNCFHIRQSFQTGFSGGPILLDGNKVVGMVVYGDTNPSTFGGTTAIKAIHIFEILSKFINLSK